MKDRGRQRRRKKRKKTLSNSNSLSIPACCRFADRFFRASYEIAPLRPIFTKKEERLRTETRPRGL